MKEERYTTTDLRVVLAEDWFIYTVSITSGLMYFYNTEMWLEWGHPNVDTAKEVDQMIPFAIHHLPSPLLDDNKIQLTEKQFEEGYYK